ncbi:MULTISPECIES: hypothetical protein [unclassified Streptomyces]|uniref:hypothetical protein n=1 Tax=unclassified Streptomyces TaxID=2593676 RepID=UPI0036FF14BC
MFHASDSVSALLSTLAVFAVGFLMRPLGGIVFVAIFGGSALAFSVGGVVTSVLSDGEVARWGWRVPFVLVAFLALAALYLRRGMDESDVFAEERSGAEARPLPKGQVARAVLLVIMMTSGITAAHHTWTSYVSTYAITQKGTDA